MVLVVTMIRGFGSDVIVGWRQSPDCGNRNGAGIGFVAEQSWIVFEPALLVDVGLDDLGCHASGKVAVFALLNQHGNYNLRIAPGGNTGKPAVVLELLTFTGFTLAQFVTDNLGAACFSGEIDSLEMGAGSSSTRIHDACHGIGDGDPVLGINGNTSRRIVAGQRLL